MITDVIFILAMVVYLPGFIFCGWTLIADSDAKITPLVYIISLIPILHWYIVFKKYDGGVRQWIDEVKKSLKNEHKGLD